jgi:hypothetical protein
MWLQGDQRHGADAVGFLTAPAHWGQWVLAHVGERHAFVKIGMAT